MIEKWTAISLALVLAACSNDAGEPTPDADSPTDTGSRSDATVIADSGGGGDMATITPDMTTEPTDMGALPDTNVPADLGPPPNPLEGIGAVELVQENFQFTEGPRWYPNESVLRFTDIPANTIFELSEPDTITSFTTASRGANGLAFDATGNVLAAEHGGRRISVYDSGVATVLIEDFEGNIFNSPNDLAVRSDGTIYFTDPPYGLNGRQREIDFNGLFRWDGTTTTAEWEGNANQTRPNGVSLSPDESVLYLADTQASKVYAFDVAADGSLSGERDFASPQSPDGMAVDVWGNLYVTASTGIEVYAPDGSSWGTIAVDRQPANCAFGGDDGKTLYITARSGLYRVDLQVEGIY